MVHAYQSSAFLHLLTVAGDSPLCDMAGHGRVTLNTHMGRIRRWGGLIQSRRRKCQTRPHIYKWHCPDLMTKRPCARSFLADLNTPIMVRSVASPCGSNMKPKSTSVLAKIVRYQFTVMRDLFVPNAAHK